MLVTFVTAVGMLGTPAEMYAFGTQVGEISKALVHVVFTFTHQLFECHY